MVINKIYKMTVEGVKSKSESFFSISHGVLELWRKNLKGAGFRPPGPDRVKVKEAWSKHTQDSIKVSNSFRKY